MTLNIIKINTEGQGQRLDKFLTNAWPEKSRSQIQKNIKEGLILVNKKESAVHYFLKENDVVSVVTVKKINPEEKIKTPTKPKATKKTKNELFKEIKIIEDNDDFMIIEKPAGLLVHPTEKQENDTLVDWLLVKYPELKKIGEDPQRPAIVHRLDKDVSGLMVIPKNQDAFDYFKSQFKGRQLTKKYLALVEGEVEREEGEINFPIGRSKNKDGLYAAKPMSQKNDKDKTALTRFKIAQRFKNYTLLEVEILTGRTHQIRVHLLAYGHPIVGDSLYLPRHKNIKVLKHPLNRIFLHAFFLSFIDLKSQKQEFTSPLPETLNNFLKNLKTA
ncbi:MAG: RluA family pseudouridine synthase [bacterium]